MFAATAALGSVKIIKGIFQKQFSADTMAGLIIWMAIWLDLRIWIM
ncbi:hypothetical protein MGWOODY_Mmi708 [hydrothermal vent metagenome]|uniref:Uncharacterized protein n=1 Tax=hydrothermal vent metagenome TaxID=652676 RepID=A0A160VFQ5_9ZZZZ